MARRLNSAQSALEYLVTYGWAILAIVIIAGLLWYFGIFNPSKFISSRSCTGFAAFDCQDFSVDRQGNFRIVLANTAGFDLDDLELVNSNQVQIPGEVCQGSNLQNNVAAGGSITCTAPVGLVFSGVTYGGFIGGLPVSVRYLQTTSGIYHVDGGTVQGAAD